MHERTRARPSLSASPPFFNIFFCLFPSPSSFFPFSVALASSLAFPPFVFIRAPLFHQNARVRVRRGAALATLARSARCQLVATHLPSRLSRHRHEHERARIRSILASERAMRANGSPQVMTIIELLRVGLVDAHVRFLLVDCRMQVKSK